MMHRGLLAGALAPAFLAVSPSMAEPLIWGVDVEQLEYRVGEGPDLFAWDFDALVGTDEYRFVWRSTAQYAPGEEEFEQLENQARVQVPISDFFDAALGVRVDTPAGPDRLHGLIGIKGLAPQWFELDADLYVSDTPFFRFEAEYESLITNRLILIPSVEIDLPLVDDRPIGAGAFGPKVEIGVRLGYDLLDRLVSPYIGVQYERVFGESADFARDEDEDVDTLYFVAGFRILF